MTRIAKRHPLAGVVILTRPDTHFPLIKEATALGLQTFVEKPLVSPGTISLTERDFRLKATALSVALLDTAAKISTDKYTRIERGAVPGSI